MTFVLLLRFITAAAFMVAIIGLARDWSQRSPHLTIVGRRQYVTYYLLMLVATAAALTGLMFQTPFTWLDLARCAVALLAAVTSNWRLHEERHAEPGR